VSVRGGVVFSWLEEGIRGARITIFHGFYFITFTFFFLSLFFIVKFTPPDGRYHVSSAVVWCTVLGANGVNESGEV